MIWRILLATGILAFATTWPAYGGLKFEFADESGASQTDFQIAAPGQTVPIRIYLAQFGTLADGEPDLADVGLGEFGIKVVYGENATAAVLAEQDITYDESVYAYSTFRNTFPEPPAPVPPSELYSAELGATTDINFPVKGNRILLGTFWFTGLTAGETTVSASEWNQELGYEDLIDGNGDDLDPFIVYPDGSSAFTAKITVNPEPSSLALSLLIAGGGAAVAAVRRRRQRRFSADGDQAEATAS